MGKSDIGNILERSGIWDSQTIESFWKTERNGNKRLHC
jgi:hypothetical protein